MFRHYTVLRHAAVYRVAICEIHTVNIDIGLNDESLTELELLCQVLADAHSFQYRFMARNDRRRAKVIDNDAGVFLSCFDEFHVGEAKADGFHLHK